MTVLNSRLRAFRQVAKLTGLTVDWPTLTLDAIPVAVATADGGPDHFRRADRPNWDHADAIYGWSAARPALAAPPTVLTATGHFQAFKGHANLAKLSVALRGLAAAAAARDAATVVARPSDFECERGCSFRGDYDTVAHHERTCDYGA